MAAIGITAEFDPFHRGHQYLIRQAKVACPDAPVVVAMSGHFTQRGGPAALRPAARAEMALRCGADLVLELPVSWAVSSAERFGQGGVAVLAAAGVDRLAFGSESGDADGLMRLAKCLEQPEFPAFLKQKLAEGIPFAAARQQAAAALIGEEAAAALGRPNDLLGVSYAAAAARAGIAHLHAVRRVGPEHNAAAAENGFASASAIRRLLKAGKINDAADLMPEETRPVLRTELEAGLMPASLEHVQRAMLYRLRLMEEADFLALPDCSEGLEHRLYRAARQAVSPEEFYTLVKSKRYAHARIRRMALWAFLGMTQADFPEQLPYLRVLGMNQRGMEQLHSVKKTCPVPIITKPAAGHKLDGEARRQFELEMRAADLWRLCLPTLDSSAGGSGWRSGPVIV